MRLVAVALMLVLVITSTVYVYGGDVYGYIVVRDAVGRIWTLGDVGKLYNTTYNDYNLGETFVLVLDGKVYQLRNMTEYNGMAAWRVPPGDYNYTVYWFGYKQNGTIHVPAGTYVELRLGTAPFLPVTYKYSEFSPWAVRSNPIGVEYKYNDFAVWFIPGGDEIIIRRLNPITMKYVNDTFSVYINGSYQWVFHLNQFGSYDETISGGYWWFQWDLVHIHEEAKMVRSGPVTILSYAVSITRNKEAYDAMETLYTMLVRGALRLAANTAWQQSPQLSTWFIDDIRSMIDVAYDTFMATWNPSGEGVTILYEVIAAPTTTIIVARAYQHTITEDAFGYTRIEKTPIPINSYDAIVYNNTAIKLYATYGGFSETIISGTTLKALLSSSDYSWSVEIRNGGYYKAYRYSGTEDSYYKMLVPGGIYRLIRGDISEIGGYVFLSYKLYVDNGITVTADSRITLNITFDDTSDADYYASMLTNYNIEYSRTDNTFLIDIAKDTSTTSHDALLWADISRYTKYARYGSTGYLCINIHVYYKIEGGVSLSWLKLSRVRYMYILYPRIEPVTYNLYLNGYTHIGSAYAVRLAIQGWNINNTWYLPSYYVFSNPPKRPLILTYDAELDNSTMGPVVNITYLLMDEQMLRTGEMLQVNYTGYGDASNPETYYARLEFQPTLDPVFQDTILGFFDIRKMSFLHLDIHDLLAGVPLYKEYGIYIWSWPERKYIIVYDEDYINKLIQASDVKGILDNLEEQWNQVARQLGLIQDTLDKLTDIFNKIGGAWDWLNQNWKWLLLGLGVFLVLIILLIAGAGSKGRIMVVRR